MIIQFYGIISLNRFARHLFLFQLFLVVVTTCAYGDTSTGSKNVKNKLFRYISKSEKKSIVKTGKISNTDVTGKKKRIFVTDREYKTAGRAKTYNQLAHKPSFVVEIDPNAVKHISPMKRINPKENRRYGVGGGNQATTRDPIKVNPKNIRLLKGAPKR